MNGVADRLAEATKGERGYPHARRAGLPTVAMHLGPAPVREALEATEQLLAELTDLGALRERVVHTPDRGVHRTSPARDALRKIVADALVTLGGPDAAMGARSIPAAIEKLVSEARAAKVGKAEEGAAVERYSDTELNEITPNGAGVRIMLARLAGMKHADFLVASAPEDATKLAELLRELPEADRWIAPPAAWHSRAERPTSIIATLCDHVAACAADESAQIRKSEIDHALKVVATRVVARRIEPEVREISARAQAEADQVAARVRRELGL